MVREGYPGHGPTHLLCASASEIGLQWDLHLLGWLRPGLPVLSNLAGPIQQVKSAILNAWRDKVAADLCAREGFRGDPLLDIAGTLQLLESSHVRERDKALLGSVVGFGPVSYWGDCEDSLCHAGSVVVLTVMVIFFGIVLILLMLRSVKILSFMIS